jgi:thioredoxin-like negative regulator of GroEL
MELACPACNKVNSLQAEECIRCSCELKLLALLLNQAEDLLTLGKTALQEGNSQEALEYANASWQIKHSQASAKLAFLATLAEQNDEEASFWYPRALSFSTKRSPLRPRRE